MSDEEEGVFLGPASAKELREDDDKPLTNRAVVDRLLQKQFEEEQQEEIREQYNRVESVKKVIAENELLKHEVMDAQKESEEWKQRYEQMLIVSEHTKAELRVSHERHQISDAAMTLNIKILGEALLQYQQQAGDEDNENT